MNQPNPGAAAFDHDRQSIYPGLTRPQLEQVGAAIANLRDGEVADALDPIAPAIATRIRSLSGAELTGYVRRLRGTVVVALLKWPVPGQSPIANDVHDTARTIEGD